MWVQRGPGLKPLELSLQSDTAPSPVSIHRDEEVMVLQVTAALPASCATAGEDLVRKGC